MVTRQMKLDLGVRQKAKPLTNLLRNRDLSFGGDLHGITPTVKNNRVLSRKHVAVDAFFRSALHELGRVMSVSTLQPQKIPRHDGRSRPVYGSSRSAIRSGLRSDTAAKPAGLAEDFTFLFITDTHIQPELNAAQGCDQCFKKARTIKSDFAIQGGDHVFDSLGVGRERASSLFDLYGKTEQDLGMKIYHTIGNHDCFGVYPASGVSPTDPLYGKKIFEDRLARRITPSTKGCAFRRAGLDRDYRRSRLRGAGRRGATGVAGRRSEGFAGGDADRRFGTIPLVTAFDSYVPFPRLPRNITA